MAATLEAEHPGIHVPPAAVHCCSAASSDGVPELMASIAAVLDVDAAHDDDEDDDIVEWDTSLPESDGFGRPPSTRAPVRRAAPKIEVPQEEAAWGSNVAVGKDQDEWLASHSQD